MIQKDLILVLKKNLFLSINANRCVSRSVANGFNTWNQKKIAKGKKMVASILQKKKLEWTHIDQQAGVILEVVTNQAQIH